MKLETALALIAKSKERYRVRFEVRESEMITIDYFPDRDEEPIKGLPLAIQYAKDFANIDKKKYVNIVIVNELWRQLMPEGEVLNEYIAGVKHPWNS